MASFLTYVWLDPIIWRAHQVPHLPHDELPPICDYDEVKNLIPQSYAVRCYQFLPSVDSSIRFIAGTGSVFWGEDERQSFLAFGQSIQMDAAVASVLGRPDGMSFPTDLRYLDSNE